MQRASSVGALWLKSAPIWLRSASISVDQTTCATHFHAARKRVPAPDQQEDSLPAARLRVVAIPPAVLSKNGFSPVNLSGPVDVGNIGGFLIATAAQAMVQLPQQPSSPSENHGRQYANSRM